MRLQSVKFSHFRGYRATTVSPIDEAMTGLLAPPKGRLNPAATPALDQARKGSRYEQ